jgi:cobalt-zinc-cadmium efflux system membrane fusion protein
MLESQAHLAEGKAALAKAMSRREVLEAEAELKRAQSAVEVAQSRTRLSDDTYQTRLQQLGTKANAKGLVTVTAPISGRVADREVTLGQSFEDAGGKLMTIVNDSQVFATANIYEKDIEKVETGQRVSVKVGSLPNRTFTGLIAVIGSVVEGETRVVPVKAELDNSRGLLKPGMFAELEILTDRTPTAILAIPTTAVVEANGKQLVYVQNGDAYQPVEVTLGQTSGNMVSVKSGLFDGDLVVTQRATQLYAQSLRGGGTASEEEAQEGTPQATTSSSGESQLPWWLVIPAGGAIAAAAFWAGRRTKPQPTLASAGLAYVAKDSPNGSRDAINPVSTPTSRVGAVSADESASMD